MRKLKERVKVKETTATDALETLRAEGIGPENATYRWLQNRRKK